MPPATGLHFYRKRQTIDHLTLERPQSLQSFRECVRKALVVIESRIDLLQQSYYGPESDAEFEINRWLKPLSIVLKYCRISFFLCKTQLDDMVISYRRAEGDPTLVVDFDKEVVKSVLDLIDRVLQYLKTGFGDIIKDMKQLGDYMWKYCLSFAAAEGDLYLDTAVNYERQRKEFSQAINFNIDDIKNMAEQFETKGMRVQDLGFVARDLAERCKATHVPFLVIIPQAFENLKHAISGIRRWLEADEAYAEFIKFDIDDLEAKKEVQEKKVREFQIKSSNSEHKLKTAKRLHGDLQAEVKGFAGRESLLSVEKSNLITQNKDVLVDLDIKQFRRDEMKHKLDELSDFEKERFAVLSKEITDLSERRPVIDKKLEDINKKLGLIADRRNSMNRKQNEMGEAKTEVKQTKKEFRKCEVELERLEVNLNRLKEIYRYKTTPEILKKIFHGMPLTARHVVNKGKKPIMDKLERACKLTACHIENDWGKLYRCLPFYPYRGEQTISNDVDEIGKEYMRHIPEEMCRQSLWRWRRMHTRASLDDLKKALLSIKRKDIVELIDDELIRRANKPFIPSPAFRTIRFPKIMSPS